MPNPLAKLIREHLAAHGPMTFRDFMEQALYDPDHGYYASGKAVIGRAGDYVTSVSVGPLFGRLLAVQFIEMWERLGRPEEFTIVEQGAHDGTLAGDILAAASGPFREAIRYQIVEPFPVMRARQQTTLGAFPEVTWRESLDDLESFTGVHFSNELLDAMPVHLVAKRNGEWRERCVDQHLQFIDAALSSEELRAHLEGMPSELPENYTTEINLAALHWIEAVSARLLRGWVLAIDYGHPFESFFSPVRTSGTLAVCRQQRRGSDPLADPGENDITAHVEFTSLAASAMNAGLALAGFTDQHHFITALCRDVFREGEPPPPATARAFKTLMHPALLGAAFHAIAFSKNVPRDGLLCGFSLGTDRRGELVRNAPAEDVSFDTTRPAN